MIDNPSKIIPARLGPGDIFLYPQRGEPPGPLVGFCDDPGNPFIKRLDLKPCKFRTVHYQRVCGGIKYHINCSLLNKSVYPIECQMCTIRQE